MQLVVMVAALALLAGAGQGCGLDCQLTNFNLFVESCGLNKSIETIICEGQCATKEEVFDEESQEPKQEVCTGTWSYMETYIEGCPIAVTYPVAHNCGCSLCNTAFTDCKRFDKDTPAVCPFEGALISS